MKEVVEAVRELFDWAHPSDGKKSKAWENTRLHNHNTTNQRYQIPINQTETKIGTARDEDSNTMTTQDWCARLEACRD